MRPFAAVVASALAATLACAHDLDHAVTGADARIVEFQYADGTPFSYESYEIFRPGETSPFQVGRTDALGRAVFIPDRDGEWRIRAFSEDGHGADFRFAVEAEAGTRSAPAEADRWSRAALGIGIILALFGFASLLQARRKTS